MLKCKKISNIIVIISFFVIITVPQILFGFLKSSIPQDTSENRKLAEKPVFDLENIDTYSTGYENYYNDNLPFRGIIRNVWTNFNFYILNESTTSQVLIGKNDGDISSSWLFFQDETEGSNSVKDAQGILTLSGKELEQIKENINKNTTELENRNIKVLYAIIPNKANLYKEKLPNNITIYKEENRFDKLEKYLEEKEIKNFIYLKDALLNAKEINDVYYKQDTHWNNFGAFIGFKEILNQIEEDYNNFEYNMEISEEKLMDKDLAQMSGIKNVLKDKEITIEFAPNITYWETVFETENKIVITQSENAPIHKTVFVVGDSFRTAMIPYFSKIYSKVVYMHRCDYGSYMLDHYQPDIIVFQLLERYIDTLKDYKLYQK